MDLGSIEVNKGSFFSFSKLKENLTELHIIVRTTGCILFSNIKKCTIQTCVRFRLEEIKSQRNDFKVKQQNTNKYWYFSSKYFQ